MKVLFLYFILILFPGMQAELLSQNQKANMMNSFAESKIKAVYGFSKQSPYFKNKSNGEIVATLKEWNINAIFGGYEDSDLVALLHQAGIKIFVEISFFVGEKWWQQFPQSRPIKIDGKLLEKEGWYAGVNPTDPDVFQAVLNKIENIISINAIDGIWLDFFRWPCHWESPHPNIYQASFDDRTIDLFLKEKQLTIPGDINNSLALNKWILNNHLNLWAEFKCDQIVRLGKKVRQLVKSKNENVLIGLFHIPWTDEDFDGAMKKIVGQDLARLAPYIDIFSPMLYHAMCGKSPQWVAEITKYVYQKTNKPVLPIIQSMDIPRKVTNSELEDTLNCGLKADGSTGIIVFNIKGLNYEKLIKLKKIFDEQ